MKITYINGFAAVLMLLLSSFKMIAHAQNNTVTESDLVNSYKYYDDLGDQKAADSVLQVAKARFPKGTQMRDFLVQTFMTNYKDNNLSKMDEIYTKCVSAYPKSNYDGIYVAYDYMRSGLGSRHANNKNFEKALFYATHFDNDFWSGQGLISIAYALLSNGDTIDAIPLVKRAVEATTPFLNPKPGDNEASFASLLYPSANQLYAELLLHQGDTEQAFIHIRESEKYTKDKNANFFMVYALILKKLGKYADSRIQLETAVVTGTADQSILNELAIAYQQKKGNKDGYDEYVAGLRNSLVSKISEKVAKEMIDEPAFPFTLKDLKGKEVSLVDLKGKVVILDFWATWCGPCIRSFPAMHKAVNKFKDDPDVQFLFIDTFERVANAEELVKTFLNTNKYPFNVLFDPSIKGGKSVSQNYNLSAIPVKIVIDGNGRIRFRLTGFTGGDDAAVEELSAMIALAKKEV